MLTVFFNDLEMWFWWHGFEGNVRQKKEVDDEKRYVGWVFHLEIHLWYLRTNNKSLCVLENNAKLMIKLQ